MMIIMVGKDLVALADRLRHGTASVLVKDG